MVNSSEKILSQETIDREPGPISVSIMDRAKEFMANEEYKEGVKALGRLFGNTALAAVEYVPVVGEVPDWIAKGSDLLHITKLTPDIDVKTKITTEAVDVTSGGLLPSRTIEGLYQAYKDYKNGKLEKGVQAISYILTGKENYLRELQENKVTLDKAAEAFS